MIHCMVHDHARNDEWNLLACYGTPYSKEKRSFWYQLEDKVAKLLARG